MAVSLRTLIDKTLLRVSLAQGADVQTYAEDEIKEIINHKVSILFDAVWWPQFFNGGETFTLDGATGVVTANLSTKIKRYMDIRAVWYKDDTYPLPAMPTYTNPKNIKLRCMAPINIPEKVFMVAPINTTGTVTVSYRTRPNPLTAEDDTIDLDETLLVLGSAYDYLNSFGTNPEAEAKILQFFDNRYKTLTEGFEKVADRSLDNYGNSGSGWQEVS